MAPVIYKLALLVIAIAIVVTLYLDWRLYRRKSVEERGLEDLLNGARGLPKSSEDTITFFLRNHPLWFWKPAALLVLFVVLLAAHLFWLPAWLGGAN